MRKRKKIIIYGLIFAIICAGVLFGVYKVMSDKTKLNITEKKYITDNASKVLSVNVVNDANVFGKDGKGLFYDFLDGFSKEYNLDLNIVTISSHDKSTGINLTRGNKIRNNDILFYTDNYVLISNSHKEIKDLQNITSEVGYLKEDSKLLLKYLTNYKLAVKEYEDEKALNDALKIGDIEYAVVPNLKYEDQVLDNLFSICYHFTDLADYYYISLNDNDKTFFSIMRKYFLRWKEDNLEKKINEYRFNTFTNKLKITEKELDVLNRATYVYGFVENIPYDTYSNKNYGGINSIYLDGFSDFSGFKIKKEKYRSLRNLKSAVNRNKVNIYEDYFDVTSDYDKIDSNNYVTVSVLMRNDDTRTFNSISSLKNEEVYAKANSQIANYLDTHKAKVITYKNDKDVRKILKEKKIVVMDKFNYINFKNNYKDPLIQERFSEDLDIFYSFYSKNDTAFNKLLSFYVSSIDKTKAEYNGLYSSDNTVKLGKAIYRILKYGLFIILILSGTIFILYKRGKKLRVKKSIKKADKMKYIDMLTSLKNRNYLNENIKIWNKNTIYPQAIIVIDLNNIRKINDTLGYEQGDKQIQAAANVLIKTQLDNSEIMRTDGNEFIIYMVGYDEKRVLSYIKKLNKEFLNLPYKHAASIGFSMILDDLKLVTDAINEAILRMKENKELSENDKET